MQFLHAYVFQRKSCTPWSKTMIYPLVQSTTGRNFRTIKKHMISRIQRLLGRQPDDTPNSFGPSHPILQMRLYHSPSTIHVWRHISVPVFTYACCLLICYNVRYSLDLPFTQDAMGQYIRIERNLSIVVKPDSLCNSSIPCYSGTRWI